MIRAVAFAFASFLLVLFVRPSPSAAQTDARARDPVPIEFSWEAPRECPSADEVRPRVELLDRTAAKLSVRGRIEHPGDRYTLVLDVTTRGSQGSRTLEDPNCHALVDAAMVVLELSLAPKEALAEPTANATGTAATTANPRPAATTRPGERARATPMPRLTITAAADADVGTLPRAAIGILAAGEFRFHPHAGLALHASYLPSVTGTVDNVSVSVQALAGSLLGCYLTTDARLVFGACGGLTVGALFGTGAGARNANGSGSGLLLSPILESHLRVQLAGALGLTLGGTVSFPLERARFVVLGKGAIHEVGYLTGSAYLGPSVTF